MVGGTLATGRTGDAARRPRKTWVTQQTQQTQVTQEKQVTQQTQVTQQKQEKQEKQETRVQITPLHAVSPRQWTRPSRLLHATVLCACLSLAAVSGQAQQSQQSSTLPSAPAASGDPNALQGGSGGGYPVQLPTQSSLFNAYLGSVQARPATPEVVLLSLNDAYRMGIENNLGLVYAKQSEAQERSQRLTTLNVLLPNMDLTGGTAVHEFNLQSEGFRPDLLSQFTSILGSGGGATTTIPLIVKVDVTQGQINLSQYLIDWAGIDLVHALGHLVKSTQDSASSSRGQVVQNVGVAYLRVIAAQSQVAFDRALLTTDAGVLYQSQQKHEAGVSANLDELRARVQYQTQEQTVTQDDNTLQKSRIALNRTIGLAPEQEIRVADSEPFAELDTMTPEEAEKIALGSRQDYQSAVEQPKATEFERKAATRERYPTLQFNGDYGVTGISGGNYHGVFGATGTLKIPIFQEAQFRSDRDTTQYQLENARAQVGNVRGQIQQQVRDSLIDLRAATATITVAKSNVALSQTALEQAIERFQAGVDDNLPAIEAESTLAQAQVQFINAQFQYNEAKLGLARNLGIIDVDFHPEWKGGHPAGVQSDRTAMGEFASRQPGN
jgi:outer membrane protein TolC